MILRAILLLLLLSGAVAWGALHAGLGRRLLWPTIEACMLDHELLRAAAPCLEVEAGDGRDRGYVILRSPLDTSHVILAPTAKIEGIEVPALRRADAPNYLAEAWANRRLASPAGRPALPADDMGLAINSRRGRTQDQFHVHIDCLRRDIKARLEAASLPAAGQWTRVQLDDGVPYAATRLAGGLEATNVIDLSARHLGLSPGEMPSLTLAVVALPAADGTPGFLVLTRQDRNRQHAELLLDHDCSGYR